jgi:hypothetical protein
MLPAKEAKLTDIAEVAVAYIEPADGGWTLKLGDDEQRFATASGAIFQGIELARGLVTVEREVWVLWRNGDAWSVAWTSSE